MKVNILGKDYELNPEAEAFSQSGLHNYERQNYVAAIADFTRAIKAQPDNRVLYTMRGTAYEDMSRDGEAANDFVKALELSSLKDFVAAYRLGMVYFRMKDFENAVKWLKISHANSIDVLLFTGVTNNNILFVHKKIIAANLGNFLAQLKRFEEGFIYLDEAIKIDPNYSNPYLTKGTSYAQMGQPKEAIPLLKKAAQLGNQQAATLLPLVERML